MAEFEGEKNLNRETSELEVKGKFKLSEEELDNVSGGCGDPEEYQVQGGWSPVCDGEFKEWGGNRLYYKPVGNCCGNCRYFYPDNKNDYSKAGVCRREFSD